MYQIDMATDNRGVMVYLTPELERGLEQYCIDNKITRKNKDGDILPSLGTGIIQYLNSAVLGISPRTVSSLSLGTVPHSPTSLLPNAVPSDRLNTGITKAEILELIAESKTSNTSSTVLTRADVVLIARAEIKQALGSLETEITNIKTTLANVPSSPLLALESPQKVESVTTNQDPTNWEGSIAELASTGMSSRQIADRLNTLGFTNSKGGAVSRQSIESYLGRRPDLKVIYENARKKGD
jgi:DNA-binding CsgD family transcriptional regulator